MKNTIELKASMFSGVLTVMAKYGETAQAQATVTLFVDRWSSHTQTTYPEAPFFSALS